MFVFDGVNKIISIQLGTNEVSVSDIYSRWKEWVATSDNAKFETAFANSVGGNPLGSGSFVGAYFFIQNGWLIRPQEADHTLLVEGNLFPIPETAPTFVQTIGNFQVNIVQRNSSLTQRVETGGSGPIDISTLATKANQVAINEGVKKSSLLLPHSNDLPNT